MIFRSDIYKILKEAINPRINTDLTRPLNQIIGDESQSIKDYFLSKLNKELNSNPNKPLDKVIKENTEEIVNRRINNDLNSPLNHLIPQRNRKMITINNITWTVPPGVSHLLITATAAGGDGGNGGEGVRYNINRAWAGGGGGGGGAGQYVYRLPVSTSPGQQFTIIVGNGNTTIPEIGLYLAKGQRGMDGHSTVSGGRGGHANYPADQTATQFSAGGGGGGFGGAYGRSGDSAIGGEGGHGGVTSMLGFFVEADAGRDFNNGNYGTPEYSWGVKNCAVGGWRKEPQSDYLAGGSGGGGGTGIFGKGGTGSHSTGDNTVPPPGGPGYYGSGGGGGSGSNIRISDGYTPGYSLGGLGGGGLVLIEW